MTLTPTIQELSIILVAQNINLTVLTQEFLKYSGIVPADWNLSQPPISNPQISQVIFTNGISLIAQFNTITFSESLQAKTPDDLKIPAIARKYVETLPNADYQAVGTKVRSFFLLEDESEYAARNYIFSTLLVSGPWYEVGKAPVRAALNLNYQLEDGELNMIISEAKLQLPDKPPQFAVLFTGNFPHQIVGDTPPQKLKHLYQLIEGWRENLKTYENLVNQKFLGKT